MISPHSQGSKEAMNLHIEVLTHSLREKNVLNMPFDYNQRAHRYACLCFV